MDSIIEKLVTFLLNHCPETGIYRFIAKRFPISIGKKKLLLIFSKKNNPNLSLFSLLFSFCLMTKGGKVILPL